MHWFVNGKKGDARYMIRDAGTGKSEAPLLEN
jgi:hypothetical protein